MAIPRVNWSKMKDSPKEGFDWKFIWYAFLAGVLVSLMVAGIRVLENYLSPEPVPEVIVIQSPEEIDRSVLNKENVLYWLTYFDVKHPDWVLSQSIQECGWNYDSYRAQELNNIFGFQTSDSNVLTFGHWIGSVIYYKKWQESYYNGENYLEFLSHYGYAQDTLYCQKLEKIHQIITKE